MAKTAENKVKSLVIVESPSKAKTIEKILGSDFLVTSSVGHIRDLPKKDMGIDIENGFKPTYEVSQDKQKVVTELKKLAKNAETVWLATDEDREGEAIAWHLFETLKLSDKKTKRIVFHEITKTAILNSIENPRSLDKNLIDAQQARRVLDRLVGYELSPVLWRKVQKGLSAGRVQSVTVRVIVEREREIDAFESEPNYRVVGDFISAEAKKFRAELKQRFEDLNKTKAFLEKIRNADFNVGEVVTKPSKRTPSAPFTTSTLQQEASRKLSFSVKQTMTVAQKLYENGFITYMRTDSLNLAESALEQAKNVISAEYGSKYSHLRHYKTKSASAQEAHEAIRPTDMSKSEIKGDSNMMRLYDLIFKRTLASQMADALLERTTANIEISNDENIFVATGEVIKFDGFLKVYFESTDDENGVENDSKILPPLAKGQNIDYSQITARETFKNPPPRYTEASLVKKLEELGIGRPSTYAPTISTIQDRGYAEKQDREGKSRLFYYFELTRSGLKSEQKTEITGAEKSKLFPTDVGMVVTDFLMKFFTEIVDFNFTAKVESEFDDIAKGKKTWQKMIQGFYGKFHKTIEASQDIKRTDAVENRVLGNDPKTGKPIIARIGRYGPMLQIGESDDEDKPKFAKMPKNSRLDQITLEEALKAFDLPRIIGNDANGVEISAQIGRFGPYLKHDKTFVSIKEEEIHEITLEEAIIRIQAKSDANKANTLKLFPSNDAIKVLNGRFGPYITDGKKNARVPKDKIPADLTLEECQELLDKAVAKPKGRGGKKK
ncbi:MAG: type I DNA topoisomerase [Ignavibacteriae bacterium HGW-Ignavibacteriae-1]|jgi:DNA topoisomerase-1|nr:MAG: type I DNA topoisomerase [Ignavibacteriae bacterium HGW-Ignavibacteriae-1]